MSMGPLERNTDREILPEEVKFDKYVYGGISYFAQAATGIALTYMLKYGAGKSLFEKATNYLGPKIYKGVAIEQAAKEISTPLMVTTMVMVGNTFLLPVKWLENRKAKIVRNWAEEDAKKKEAQGTPYTAEELARQEKALKDLENEPVQSWSSLLGGRVAGLLPVFALAYGLGQKGEVAEQMAANTVKGGFKLVGANSIANSPKLENLVKVGFLDVFYSMIAAGGLYTYSHYLHPSGHKKSDEGAHLPGPTPALPIVDTTPTKGMRMIPDEPESARQKRKFTDDIHPNSAIDPLKANPKLSHRQRIAVEELSDEAQSVDFGR